MNVISGDSSTMGTPRYRELDALRGFAAIGIVLWHYRINFQAAPLLQLLEPFYRAAYYWRVFFCLLPGSVLAKAHGGGPGRGPPPPALLFPRAPWGCVRGRFRARPPRFRLRGPPPVFTLRARRVHWLSRVRASDKPCSGSFAL